MPASVHIERRVEFRDTDAAGIMHFSAFFVYMEQAEHETLRRLGFSVVEHDDDGVVSWPRVSAKCDYKRPAHFEDVLDIAVSVARLGTKSVTYEFRFTHDADEIALGIITVVCCRIEKGKPPRSIEIPKRFAAALATLCIRS